MRCKVLKKLEDIRIQKHPLQQSKIVKNTIPYPYDTLDYSFNILNKKTEAFYKRYGVKKIEYALESTPHHKIKHKKVMTTKYCIRHQLNLCNTSKKDNKFLILFDGKNKYKLFFNCDDCMMELIYFFQ